MTDTREEQFVLKAFSGEQTDGIAVVRSFDRGARLRRAFRGLALFWLAAIVSILIPVAHFVLVPGFAIAGLVVLMMRLRAHEEVERVHGTCPDCGTEQDFDAGGAWITPKRLVCANCGRGSIVHDPAESQQL